MNRGPMTTEPSASRRPGAYALFPGTAWVFLFPAKYSGLSLYVRRIEMGLPAMARREEVMVGIAEALSNAILHGALGVSSRARDAAGLDAFLADVERAERRFGATGQVSVTLRTFGSTMKIVVRDDGAGFDWTTPFSGDRGISILHRVFDGVRWSPRGNAIHLTMHGVDL